MFVELLYQRKKSDPLADWRPKGVDDGFENPETPCRLAGVRKMETITTIIALVFLCLGMAGKKKQSVFGQLTLGGELALDWLKPGSAILAGKIMLGPIDAFDEYMVPDWAKERNTQIAIIESGAGSQNPLLVTQNGVMRALERQCAEWEAQGANCFLENDRAVIEFDEPVDISFKRDSKKGKFAPYEMFIK